MCLLEPRVIILSGYSSRNTTVLSGVYNLSTTCFGHCCCGHLQSFLYSFSDKKLYSTWRWPQQQWSKHVVDVDKLHTPDNTVVLQLLYPYRIITLGLNWLLGKRFDIRIVMTMVLQHVPTAKYSNKPAALLIKNSQSDWLCITREGILKMRSFGDLNLILIT